MSYPDTIARLESQVAQLQSARMDEARERDRLRAQRDALVKALAAMLDTFGGYSGVPACDEAITAMQALGLDRWSMQASMEKSAINANVTPAAVGEGKER